MKIGHILLTGSVVVFFLFHAVSIKNRWLSVKAKEAYYQGDVEQQQTLYDRIGSHDVLAFSEGTVLYKTQHFDKATQKRTTALQQCTTKRACADTAYNLGNASFFLGSGAAGREETKTLREQAVAYYEQSLRLRDDEKAEHNKAVVENLLEELERQQQEQQQQSGQPQQQQQQQPSDSSQQDQLEQDQQGSQDEQENSENGNDQDMQQDQQGQPRSSLSEADKQELQQYQQQLEQQQRMAQEYFNKAPQQGQPQGPQDMFDMFFGAPDQREEMNAGSEEKDR